MAQQSDFSQNSMRANILHVSIPLMIAELVNVLYNIVDRLYLARIPEVGLLALTGIGITAPLLRLISAFAHLGGRGGSPLFSIARGAKQQEEASLYMGNTLSILIVLSVLVTIVGYVFMEPLLYWSGADMDTIPYAKDYFSIYLSGTFFVILSLGMNSFINAQGFSRVGMLSVTIGAVVNLILDPVFIFGLNMGVKGAAIATVIGQFCSALWVMLFLCGKKAIFPLTLKSMRLSFHRVRGILALGLSSFVMAATTSAVGMACNSLLERLGGYMYVAVMTVINSITGFLQIPFVGFGHGCQPVLGYNYGAKEYGRLREGILLITKMLFVINLVCWLLILLLPGPFVRLFHPDPAFIQTAIPCIRIYFACFIFMTFQCIGQNVHVALGKSRAAIFFSLFRKVILVMPLMFLLSSIPALGVMGVFLAEPISEVISGTTSYLAMLKSVSKATGESWRKQPEPTASAS